MFKLRLFDDKHYKGENVVDAISIRCSNFNKDTILHIKYTTIEGMITIFVLNAILNHVGMSWIICSNNGMFYKIEENNHPDWFNTGTWYNKAIC